MTKSSDIVSHSLGPRASAVREVQHPRRVLIVGGGTAGWITACLLRRAAPAEVMISLIGSSDIPTVGVGEATLPGIRTLLRYIGVDEAELAGVLPDNRERLRDLRQAWDRGERPAGEPDRDAYARAPHQLVTGYLTDGQEVPWAPSRSRA